MAFDLHKNKQKTKNKFPYDNSDHMLIKTKKHLDLPHPGIF